LAKELKANYAEHNLERLFEIVRSIREHVSATETPFIAPVIKAGILGLIVNMVEWDSNEFHGLACECAWILANVASLSGEETALLHEMAVIPKMIQLLSSKSQAVNEQALWTLANMAGDECLEYRDELIEHEEFMVKISEYLVNFSRHGRTFQEVLLWLVANLCRGKPYPPEGLIADWIPLVLTIIPELQSPEMTKDGVVTLAYMAGNSDHLIDLIVENEGCKVLIQCLANPTVKIHMPALRAIAQICSGEDQYTDHLIELGVLPILSHLLDTSRMMIVRETIWAISNILAGTSDQIQRVMETDIFAKLDNLTKIPDPIICKEILFCYSHVTGRATNEQIAALVNEFQLIEKLIRLADIGEFAVQKITLLLDAIENILRHGSFQGCADDMGAEAPQNPYAIYIERIDAYRILERLQEVDDPGIVTRTQDIVSRYFDAYEAEGN
jgi:hypothetical protein